MSLGHVDKTGILEQHVYRWTTYKINPFPDLVIKQEE